ncbi:pyridoxamine 5'-phosphate oxidase family protein [Pseudonocardia thermophila]|jgi:PPOX class probable F420-dependent enzyme, MSMEG_5819 family|uniref:Pyridoxamine 5'-phosphate oxidase family protein n=2 Tax=Pseudonocardia thermophila TaxID=1848 RepID=A0A1M6XYW3_PSETH|nr:pyridoxamine 5'-phosphate oxidase family protein [Pseudonocardia thermophila]
MSMTSSPFTAAELAYLQEQRLARLATIGPDGAPQVRPVAFAVDPVTGAIDIAGRANPKTQKWRNVLRDGRAALVVDDVLPPWRPRSIEVRGTAEVLPDEPGDAIVPGAPPGIIRIRPTKVLAFGIEEDGPGTRTVHR